MKPVTETVLKKGLYLGTEIEEKWWKRYRQNGFFMRGNGKYWFDDKAFYFLRYLTKEPLLISFDKIVQIKSGKWHSGKWVANLLILKILWVENNLNLSSGFVITKNSAEFHKILEDLRCKIRPFVT